VPKTSSGKVRRGAARELYRLRRFERRGASLRTRWRLAQGALARAVRSLAWLGRAAYVLYLLPIALLLILLYWTPVALWRRKRAARIMARRGSRALLRLLGCRFSTEGLEHLNGLSGPLVLVANHTSHFDVPALLALLPFDVAFVAKHEVLSWPIVGTFARQGAHPTVDRLDAREGVAVAGRITEALGKNEVVVFFPEGTFTAASGLRPFRLGAFKAAIETGCPVVPLALTGVRAVLRGDSLIPRPGPIRLWIGAPITPPRGADFRAVVALRDRVAAAILAHCGEPRLDLVAGGVAAARADRP
jgi:1-acyl-sn-glycerol-3-phosphate acyltransferase